MLAAAALAVLSALIAMFTIAPRVEEE